ncbi:MAG: ATP-dependent helicase HrpB [Deltaproteobacteria bacterium]|nr:MAG: ATP-dependent helicase HrpB [Deltaproteobacteria bacterium]
MPAPLPIDAVLPDVLSATRSGAVVVSAPTGAGKTTRLPPALDVEGAVWVVQPRRVAARAAARRMAEENGWRVGEEVGWHVRFDRRFGPNTRVLCMTSGMLLQALRADPFLDGVGAVVFDEVHERALDLDLGLALVEELRRDARDDLLLVAMSATVDASHFGGWLGAPVVASQGRSFPVDIAYLPYPDDRPVEEQVAEAVRRALDESEGNVLAFLPGVGEIRRTHALLDGLPVVELYGDLPPEKQDAVLRPGPGRRVVLATNVAESSVTVPDVRTVIDSGLARRPELDPSSGLDALRTVRISAASADQRAGRAGRTGPGRCLRLWTAREQAGLEAFDPPEIRRVSVAGALLALLEAGIDPRGFRWLEPPSEAAFDEAERLLAQLGATEGGGITALGRRMAALPLHPRLARLVAEGARLGQTRVVATAAALLSERDPLRGETVPRRTGSDLLDRVQALEAGRGHAAGRSQLFLVRDQLERAARSLPVEEATLAEEALARAALAAWPDRVARRRGESRRARMVGGKGVELRRESGVHAELFVAIDVEPRSGDAPVRLASPVEVGWLTPEEREVVWFDADSQRVRAEVHTVVGDLVLGRQTTSGDPQALAEALERAAAADPARVMPADGPWPVLRHRLAVAHRHLGEPWPNPDEVWVAGLLPELCAGCRSFEELRRGDWVSAVRNRLGYHALVELDRLAPERVQVPSGSHVRVDYSDPEHPVLAVRMQELFGLRTTPTILAGKPLRLHLLAPNLRPQQVTEDLAGFWERTWPEVRKELRARYPKHAWPEDPLSAEPLRGAKRRT